MNKIYLPFILLFLILLLLVAALPEKELSFKLRREKVLSDLHSAIHDAEKHGNYNCCIEPPCTMCYMGNWIWKDGICRCDDMIAKGEDDKVCPQCLRGLEQGQCKYTQKFRYR